MCLVSGQVRDHGKTSSISIFIEMARVNQRNEYGGTGQVEKLKESGGSRH